MPQNVKSFYPGRKYRPPKGQFAVCAFSLAFMAFFCFINSPSFAQNGKAPVAFHFTSSHTSFPDARRQQGPEHYSDSTVLVIAPGKLDADKQVDLIFWFHGWHNNIDTAAAYYQLRRQFMAAKINAVLVLPEAAKDAADSYGGKLENPGVFRALTDDLLKELKRRKMIGAHCGTGHILLGGHSGGGELISYIVENGQINIDEAVLFDALYGGTEKFMTWIRTDTAHRFIHLYTDYGYGPKEESDKMLNLLGQAQIPFFKTEERLLTPKLIGDTRLLYIHSLSQHNDIIFNPDNFSLLFANSPFLSKIKD